MSPLPVRAVRVQDQEPVPSDAWFAQVPAVAQVLREGWPLDQVTVLVGDNGAGKSTLVEAVAMMFGMAGEGGSTGSAHATRRTESELWRYLRLEREIGAPRSGFFLRAETMHSFYSYLEDNPGRRPEPVFHEMSHGESFLALVTDRMTVERPGLFLLDEPESALSFTGCLALVAHLTTLVRSTPSQVLVSTHSPVLAALPGATVYEVGDWGMRRCEWDALELVSATAGSWTTPTATCGTSSRTPTDAQACAEPFPWPRRAALTGSTVASASSRIPPRPRARATRTPRRPPGRSPGGPGRRGRDPGPGRRGSRRPGRSCGRRPDRPAAARRRLRRPRAHSWRRRSRCRPRRPRWPPSASERTRPGRSAASASARSPAQSAAVSLSKIPLSHAPMARTVAAQPSPPGHVPLETLRAVVAPRSAAQGACTPASALERDP